MAAAKINVDREKIVEFARKWHLREFSLFGSVLRDDFQPDSDVDVLISFMPGHAMTLESFIEMRDELRGIFGREVDLVEKQLVRNPFRRHEILTTRQVLYAA
ncbi:MAG TPA: nucleotidyltransferase domain-containing protein [Tepidisphaeraceae bacterium]|jgi:predicted nucleotidyltransferase|nr:nucleotidyltransferase domain-containing protein [Tepidisphaeraceae bacterium]